MTNEAHRCRLLDLQGAELSAAGYRLVPGADAWMAVLSAFDRPGHVVRRCLLGPLRDVRLEYVDSAVLRGRVEQVSYHPEQGRVCRIRLAAGGPLLPPLVPSRSAAPPVRPAHSAQ